jgi:thiol-disulfide isomerase/thioredoxin
MTKASPLVRRLPLLIVPALLALSLNCGRPSRAAPPDQPKERKVIAAPELEGGVAWLNTAGPLKLKDLRGKIVVLDFWTLCCINCIHTIPDLKRLEEKYPNELVVIGVHSPKFENEKDTESIRKAILRYEVTHPIVNDAERKLWESYECESWPTLWLIDPEGNLIAHGSGEGLFEPLDKAITELIKVHKERKTLNDKPLKFDLARNHETGASPLFFPGKVLADAASNRLFIADSTHHRIVITDLDGKKIAIAGAGQSGYSDGAFDSAKFNDPQGMALYGDTLIVCDRKNHVLRSLDLKNQKVTTLAGTGEQGHLRRGSGPARKMSLNSPWDLYLIGNDLFIAQAGYHQIWKLDLKSEEISLYAGNGFEFIRDAELLQSCFAQPSGLASDGKTLYVADSEASAVRALPLDGKGEVKTVVGVEGRNLFQFGDKDGVGDEVRLQHALGVAFHEGKLYVADTYNSKIKIVDPAKGSSTSWLGGDPVGWLGGPVFSEPAGLSVANGKLYVADTNAHRIRVVDLKTKAISTLKLQGVEAPKMTK